MSDVLEKPGILMGVDVRPDQVGFVCMGGLGYQ